MPDPSVRIVVDLGNSRMKWGQVAWDGGLAATTATPLDDPTAWRDVLHGWARSGVSTSWAISTVNPPVADALAGFLNETEVAAVRWFRSAADVPVRHALATPETTGADRALAVAMASSLHDGRGPGCILSCGTAVTVERVDHLGIWRGGAIAAGFGLVARALHSGTAQLPALAWADPVPPAPWGDSTRPALLAGIYWGVVGGVGALLHQARESSESPWEIWTGGDAPILARHLASSGAEIQPHLILEALARFGFDDGGRSSTTPPS